MLKSESFYLRVGLNFRFTDGIKNVHIISVKMLSFYLISSTFMYQITIDASFIPPDGTFIIVRISINRFTPTEKVNFAS